MNILRNCFPKTDFCFEKVKHLQLRLPGVEPGSIAWKAIILTVGLQTLGGRSLSKYYISFCYQKMSVGEHQDDQTES